MMRKLTLFWIIGLLVGASLSAQEDAAAESVVEVEEAAESAEPEEDTSFKGLIDEAMTQLSDLFEVDFGDNTFGRLLVSFCLIFLTLIVRKVVVHIMAAWLHRIARKTTWKLDDELIQAIKSPLGWFIFLVGVLLALSVLDFSEDAFSVVLNLFKASTLTVVFWGVLRVIDVIALALAEVARKREMDVEGFIPLMQKSARTFMVIVAVILVVQNLGYSVSSLLAGLGIGGLAVALAAQESLGNFFGSVSLVADRPFRVGDWIQVGNKIDGDVEEIGLRSTKIRTWSKSVKSVPNKVLANEIIENWSAMPKRRVKQYVGITYSTPPDTVKKIVDEIREYLKGHDDVNQEFILVQFVDFGDSSLQILVYYFTKTIAWVPHMKVREEVGLDIMRIIEKNGSSIAFPTRSIQFEGEVAEKLADGFSGS